MLRVLFCSIAAVALFLGGLSAEEKNKKASQPQQATITKIDSDKHTITLRIKDKDGKKAVEKTFELAGDVRLYDQAGKVTKMEVFQVGVLILAIEKEGKIIELSLPKAEAQPSETQATIIRINPDKNTITWRMKDRDGKEVDKTFKLTGEVQVYDQEGRVVKFGVLKVGRIVLAAENQGKLLDLRLPKEPKKEEKPREK
jgi:hypothetical protein